MAFEVIRENIVVESISGEGTVQALIEGSVLLPAPARDAAALYTDARLKLGNVEMQSDRVAMDGQVFFTLLYASGEEGTIQSVETAMSISQIFEIPGVHPKMSSDLWGSIEHTEAEISGGRATLRAIASLHAQATGQQTISCISSIEDVANLQTLTIRPQSLCTIARGSGSVTLDERFELPYGLDSEEVLFTQARANIERTIALEDHAELFGQVLLDVFHRTALFDRPIIRTRHTMTFTAPIELPSCRVSSPIQADVHLRDISAQLQREEDGAYLYCEVTLGAEATAQERTEIEAISDAYAASDALLSLSTLSIPMRSEPRSENDVDSIKAMLSPEAGIPPTGSVLATFARPSMWELFTDSRTHAEGVLEVTVLYSPSGGGRPLALIEEIPFRATYDFLLPDDNRAILTVEDPEAIQITVDKLELKCSLRLSAQAYETTAYPLAVDAELLEDEHEIPGGVTLYFAQRGDTLWSVAKQFRTTPESLARFNPDISELSGGEKLLLYTRKIIK